MTREEAIIHVGTFRAITKDLTKYKGKAIDKAFDMAIKALKQEPCPNAISRSDMLDAIGHGTTYTSEELQKIIKALPPVNLQPCDAAISRQWLMECVNEGWIKFDTEKDENRFIHLIRDIAPPVTPQPKTGHWIFQDITQGKRMWCSNCNSAFDLCCNQIKRYDEATKKEYLWGHCPWCGAKMVEPQERSEKE